MPSSTIQHTTNRHPFDQLYSNPQSPAIEGRQAHALDRAAVGIGF